MTDGEAKLNLAGIIGESIVDGPGLRLTVFCQGCPHKCKGCHNPETWSFEGGRQVSAKAVADAALKNPMLQGVTFSGGEPFCQAKGFRRLAEIIKKESSMNIVVFSGYTYEELTDMAEKDEDVKALLGLCDILIDGPFLEEEKNLTLRFRGSANQRIIDVKRSLEAGEPVLDERYM